MGAGKKQQTPSLLRQVRKSTAVSQELRRQNHRLLSRPNEKDLIVN